MNAHAYVKEILCEAPNTDVAKSCLVVINRNDAELISPQPSRKQQNLFAVTALTTGAALTIAWIGLLGWLLVHAVRVALG